MADARQPLSASVTSGAGVCGPLSPPPPLAEDGSARAKRRRDLMLDDEVLKSDRWEPRAYVLWKRIIYWLLCILTAGTVWVIANWSCLRRTKYLCLSRACRQADAQFFIIRGSDGSIEVPHVEPVMEVANELLGWRAKRAKPAVELGGAAPRMLVYRHVRFLYSPAAAAFRQLDPEDSTAPAAVDRLAGLSTAAAAERLSLFGRNVIDIPIPPWYTLLLRECVHPFVVFQIWAVIVWMTELYYTFSAFIFATAILTAVLNFWEVRKNLIEIRALSAYSRPVTVIRAGLEMRIDSLQLVPGDIMSIENDMKLPCDAVLIAGQATVNEAMLTGESTVVTKTPAPPALDLNDAAPRHTLFGGSLVAQVRGASRTSAGASAGAAGHGTLAVVARTAFDSVKGRLVLSILYPRSPSFKFLEQSLMFVGFLFALAMVGFGINAKALADVDTPVDKIIQRGCDMVTIVVPPALPLALTVGTAFALLALRKDKVQCISPQRVNLAGKINCVCFDKTGTLSTEGLEFRCVKAAVPLQTSSASARFEPVEAREATAVRPQLRALMATCHTLTTVKSALAGDPLDLQTFNFSGAFLHEQGTHGSATGSPAGASSGAGAAPAIVPDAEAVIEVPVTAAAASAFAPDASDAALPAWAAQLAAIDAALVAAASAPPPASPSPFPSHSKHSLPSLAAASSGALAIATPGAGAAAVRSGSGSESADGSPVALEFGSPGPADPLRSLSSQAQSLSTRTRPISLASPGASKGQGGMAGRSVLLPVVRVFEFVPALQRMGVVVRVPAPPSAAAAAAMGAPSAPTLVAFVKGAPEMIASLCVPASVPADFDAQLRAFTSAGLRVIAAASRILPADTPLGAASGPAAEELRRSVEAQLLFLGFIVLENPLKPESAPAIARLQSEAALPTIMITGDNAVTAVCIARDCGIVPAGYRVFIGDLAQDYVAAQAATAAAGASGGAGSAPGTPVSPSAGTRCVVWRDVDDESSGLDPDTLLPAAGLSPASTSGVRPSVVVPSSSGSGSGSGASSSLTKAPLGPNAPYVLAMTGRAYAALSDAVRSGDVDTAFLQRACLQCRVFARMSPEGKASVVETLQSTKLYVMMVGDGANDSLALRAAHVGISLSQAEASVSAPFTCLRPDIACVPRVLCEGRGALATSFQMFGFMALYSTIQFANALLIVFRGSFLSNNEYLYQDLFIVFILALTLGNTPSSRTLTVKRPSANLLSLYNLLLSCGFIALTFGLQAWAFYAVEEQPWYDTEEYPASMNPDDDEEGTNSVIPTTTSVFLMAMLQYLAVATIFSIGWPWKRIVLRNWAFTAWMIVVAAVSIWIFVDRNASVYEWIGLMVLPEEWTMKLFAYSWLSFCTYFAFLGLLYMLRRSGTLSWLQRRLGCGPCKRTKSLHRRMREVWTTQMAAITTGHAPAKDTHAAVVLSSPLRAALGAAGPGYGSVIKA